MVGASAGHADGLAAADGASSSKRSHAGVMIAGNQERVCDDSIARAINYKDVELVLVRNRQSATAASMPVQFTMEVGVRHWKGELHKPPPEKPSSSVTLSLVATDCPASKDLIWHQCSLLLACPVTPLVAPALDDDAFRNPDLRDASKLLALRLPPGQNTISIHWHEDILETPILRARDEGRDTSAPSLLTALKSSYQLKQLGKNTGLPSSSTFYDIRRGVSNAKDAIEDLPDMRQLLAIGGNLRDGAATDDTDLFDDADEELERQLFDIEKRIRALQT
ncbi:hypothetical protein LTR53_007920 [Teratosphaeriaceae sp. CCFEE 6253]|nr:hypothetical protein LTR53_007920 [Teratosphaeriaceae sp. CCFEE 6253]